MANDTQSRPVTMMRQKSLEKWARSHVAKARRHSDESDSSIETENSPFASLTRKTAIVSNSSQSRRWISPFSRHQQNTAALSSEAPPNVLEWLQSSCPSDLIPKVLAFAGPQMMSRLNQTNRFFHETIQKDETWRVVCEELYKVRSFAHCFTCQHLVSHVLSAFSSFSGNPVTRSQPAGLTCISGRLVFQLTTRLFQRHFKSLVLSQASADKIKNK